MGISIEAVKNVFLNILKGRMTREEADRLAYSIVKASEGEYLHTEEDIWKTLQNILNVNRAFCKTHPLSGFCKGSRNKIN